MHFDDGLPLFLAQSAGVNFDAVVFRPIALHLKKITGLFRRGVFVEIDDRSDKIDGCFTCPLKCFFRRQPNGVKRLAWNASYEMKADNQKSFHGTGGRMVDSEKNGTTVSLIAKNRAQLIW